MKAKEELNALKNEVEMLNQKLSTLTDEEHEQVTGGVDPDFSWQLEFEDHEMEPRIPWVSAPL